MHGKILKAHQNIGLNWLTRYVLFELNFEKKIELYITQNSVLL